MSTQKTYKTPWLPPEQYYAKGDSYAARTYWLAQLGFRSYGEYLGSDLWQKVRKRAMKRCKWRCKVCGETANQIHHSRYHKNDLTGKTLKNLHAICGTHHTAIEFSLKGKKKDLKSANYVLSRLSKKEFKGTPLLAAAIKANEMLDAEFDAIFGLRMGPL